MEDDVVFSSLDKFQIDEFAIGIELGDEAVVIGDFGLAVYARNEIALDRKSVV